MVLRGSGYRFLKKHTKSRSEYRAGIRRTRQKTERIGTLLERGGRNLNKGLHSAYDKQPYRLEVRTGVRKRKKVRKVLDLRI